MHYAAIFAFIAFTVVPIVISVFRALGIGLITYIGIEYGLDAAETFIFSRFDALPIDLYKLLALGGFRTGFQILFSAMTASLAFKALAGFTRWKLNNSTFTA